MKLAGKIPVEPLDDERVVNLERRVVANAGDRIARPVRAHRPWLPIAGAVVAIAVAFVVGWKLRAPAAATGGGGSDDGSPARIAVRADAERSTLDLGDATIDASPNTAYTIARPDGGVLVELARGKVALAVGKRGARPPLVVRAGDTDVIVVGTHFSVDYHDGTGDPDVAVTEGVVRVVRRATRVEVRVAASQEWHATTGVIALADLTPKPVIGDSAGSDNIEITTPREGPPMRDHVAAVPDAKIATTQPHVGSGSNHDVALAGGPEVTRKPPGFGDPRAPHAARDKAIRAGVLPPPAHVAPTAPAAAVAAYYTMLREKQSGDDESKALYGIAYTQAILLGRTADALNTIEQYRRRFVGQPGRYAELDAVLWLKVRLACLEPQLRLDCVQVAAEYKRDASEGAPNRAIVTFADE